MLLRVWLSHLRIHSTVLLAIVLLNSPSLAQSQTTRRNFVEIPLSSFKQPLLSGDPNQLPLIVLRNQFKGKRVPSVVFDRSNPKRIVAIVSQPSETKASYRVEIVPTDSLCDCQRWKVVWIGKQS